MICVLLEWTFTARNLMIGLHYQNPLNIKQNFSRQKLVLQSINNFICLQERINRSQCRCFFAEWLRSCSATKSSQVTTISVYERSIYGE